MTLILKPKHSLLGKSLLPVIVEIKAEKAGIDTLARLKIRKLFVIGVQIQVSQFDGRKPAVGLRHFATG
jgi:hypothetical protein